MAWYHLKHKETGEEQFVNSLKGINQEAHEVKKISRPPTEFDEVVDGRLKRNEEEASIRDYKSMPLEERLEWLEARLAFLEGEVLAK